MGVISSESFYNIAVGISAILVPIFSIVGFRKWKSELHGKNRYDLSRKVLLKVYDLRDAIQTTRSPGFQLFEWADRKKRDDETSHQKAVRDQAYAYSKRLKIVKDKCNEIRLIIHEIEMFWKSEGTSKIQNILDYIEKLNMAYSVYFIGIDKDPSAKLGQFYWQLFGKDVFKERDEYGDEFNALVNACEAYFVKDITSGLGDKVNYERGFKRVVGIATIIIPFIVCRDYLSKNVSIAFGADFFGYLISWSLVVISMMWGIFYAIRFIFKGFMSK
ncbi:MAG: hypothetical protein ABIE74_12785 [Pseudomonadota bacterium]